MDEVSENVLRPTVRDSYLSGKFRILRTIRNACQCCIPESVLYFLLYTFDVSIKVNCSFEEIGGTGSIQFTM